MYKVRGKNGWPPKLCIWPPKFTLERSCWPLNFPALFWALVAFVQQIAGSSMVRTSHQRSQVVDLISRNIFLSLYVIKLEWQAYYGIFINVKNYQFINITYLYQCFPNIEICNMGIFVMCEILLEVGLLDTSSLVRPIHWINSRPWIKIVNGNSGNVIVDYAVAMDGHFWKIRFLDGHFLYEIQSYV